MTATAINVTIIHWRPNTFVAATTSANPVDKLKTSRAIGSIRSDERVDKTGARHNARALANAIRGTGPGRGGPGRAGMTALNATGKTSGKHSVIKTAWHSRFRPEPSEISSHLHVKGKPALYLDVLHVRHNTFSRPKWRFALRLCKAIFRLYMEPDCLIRSLLNFWVNYLSWKRVRN